MAGSVSVDDHFAGLAFAAGPITADTAKTMFERMAEACAKYPKDVVLIAHIWQGKDHPDGVVVELCDKHDHGKGQIQLRQATLAVQL